MYFFKNIFKKGITPFGCLNITQFFSALNDNIYKLLLVFLLISIKGPQHTNTILSLAGAIFVLPFLLFASLAGTLADRFSKREIIFWTRLLEIVIVCLGVLAFAFESATGGYIVLSLMALQSALFSPAKYGIVPELVETQRISQCNGLLTATTYLAIILGTFLASFLTDITHRHFVTAGTVCILISILGLLSTLKIPYTEAQARDTKVSLRLISSIYHTLKRARKQRYLLSTLIFGAFFLFMGAYTQLNMIPFAMQSLHLTEVQGGYLFLMTAIGIGIGSFLAGRIARKEVELGTVPLAALGISLIGMLLFFFSSYFFVVVPLLILLGICGGFYIVPIDAFIQFASPNEDRGQNVAASNFLNFLGVVVASGLIALLGNYFHLTAAQGFFLVGLSSLCISLLLLLLMADQVLRFLAAHVVRRFWKLRVEGQEKIDLNTPSLLVTERTSWIDTLIVMATLPRLIRYIVPIHKPFKGQGFLFRILRLIPIDMALISAHETILSEIKQEIKVGHSVCFMQPRDLESDEGPSWNETIEELLKQETFFLIPIHITRDRSQDAIHPFKSLFKQQILVSYGETLLLPGANR